jgi:hypothetical protein
MGETNLASVVDTSTKNSQSITTSEHSSVLRRMSWQEKVARRIKHPSIKAHIFTHTEK